MADVTLKDGQEDLLRKKLQEEANSSEALINDDALSSERERNIKYYLGETPDLPKPGIGRSAVVSQNVSDVIDGLMPGLMEVVLGEPPVSFEALGPDDTKAAQQETAACEHVLFVQNKGFIVVHDALKSGLLEKDGYIKVQTKKRSKIVREVANSVTDEMLAVLEGEPEEKTQVGVDPMTGAPLYDVTIAREVSFNEVKITAVPAEDMRVGRSTRGDISESNYVGQKLRMTGDELMELGIPREEIEQLKAAPPEGDEVEKLARRRSSASSSSSNITDPASAEYEIIEHFVRVDLNEDGRVESYIVHTTDDTEYKILKVQDAEDHDFASWSPIRVPHRHNGRAVADKTVPYAQLGTSLLRTLMDGFYNSVNPRPVIGDDIANEHTLDDYLMVRPGAPIRTAKTMPIPLYQPMPTMQHAGPIIEMVDAKQEYSTGFSRAGVSIDKNSFNSTATGADILNTAQQATQKLYARMFVEQCMTRVFELIHRHLRTSNIQTLPLQVEEKWIELSPREWKERKHIAVNVNLGPSTKQQDQQAAVGSIQLTSQIIQLQKGDQGPYVYPANVHAVMRNFYEVHGRKNFSQFITDPTQEMTPERAQQLGVRPQPPQPPEAPEVTAARIQAEAFKQVEALKAEMKMQTTLQVEQIKAAVDMQIARMEAMMDAKLQQMKNQLDHEAKLHANVTRPQPQAPQGGANV